MQQRFADLPEDPDALAAVIERDIARLRELEFRRPIAVQRQSREDFGRYVDAAMERSMPAGRLDAFGRVSSKLGLYRGPPIEDAAAVMRELASSQVAAYYDPEESAFYVLLADAPMTVLAPIYAHELYHGLQDQYFDLDAYLLDGAVEGLNDDELFARQAVVEGEASYIMNIWMLEKAAGSRPSRFALGLAVMAQSLLGGSSLVELAGTDGAPALGADLQASLDAIDEIPPFLLESLLATYLKGMVFVHGIAAPGWDAVARLYEDPPQSSEQILHPERYLERDTPVAIDLPDLADEPALAGWSLLDSNVIGEFQLRLIFSEAGLTTRATLAAAGWDGDRYAVLERDGELLLLLYTVWDDPGEAEEFATSYREILADKYPEGDVLTVVEQRGADVLIVEGGDIGSRSEYLDVLARSRKGN